MKKVLSAIGIAALAATAFVAAPAQAATKLKIAHIPKLGTIGYFQAAHKGVERACKELKANCAYKGPTEITAAAQVKEINAAVQGGYNVLIVAAFVTGLGLPNDMKTYIKDGSGAQASLWDVENFGYVAVQVANSIVNKKQSVKVGATIKSGKGDKGLKTRTVTKGAVGNEIILGPATVFTAANVDQFNF